MQSVLATYVIDQIESYAYNYTLAQNISITAIPFLKKNKKVPIKDIFDMTVGISTSSLISLGLAIPSPAKNTAYDRPLYLADDFIKLQSNIQLDIFRTYYDYDPINSISLWIAFLIFLIILYFSSQLLFDHKNYEKSYDLLFHFLNEKISSLEQDLVISKQLLHLPTTVRNNQRTMSLPPKKGKQYENIGSPYKIVENTYQSVANDLPADNDEELVLYYLRKKWKTKNKLSKKL